jgi:rfaE bifunctional protein nucleotidyltransferase chain/domain
MTQRPSGKARDKIKDIEDLAEILVSIKAEKKKIVHCHGVFDLLHIGHTRHFEQAKTLGDLLVVTVTPDIYVNKGPHRPAFTESLRAEAIAALDCTDYVAINKWPTAVETIHRLKPDIYAKGSDYKEAAKDHTGKILEEEEAIKSVGGRIVFTEDITFSSSTLLNRYLPGFSEDVKKYLTDFSRRHSSDHVIENLDRARSLRVLVVGETIVDEYQYCNTIGKAAKEPILAAQYLSTEKFAGGTLAVSNHVANFCDNVGLLTLLGERESQEEFVRAHIRDNVDPVLLHKSNSPTIVKRRFVENYSLQKLFEVYVINDEELEGDESRQLCDKLSELLPHYDMVIVVDYGHGMLNKEAVDTLCREARFLAVNAQANAGNKGFNTVSKYWRADYICIAEHEIRLEARSRQADLKELILGLSRSLECGKIIVTRGNRGCLCYSQEEGFFEIPAVANQVVDRIGIGDAFLSLTSLCVMQKTPMEMVGFIGNVVGAEAVAMVCNRTSIERSSLYKHIVSLLQ